MTCQSYGACKLKRKDLNADHLAPELATIEEQCLSRTRENRGHRPGASWQLWAASLSTFFLGA